MNKVVKRYKFLRTGNNSENGYQVWKKGKWEKVAGKLDICHRGFHCSKNPYDAFLFVQGEILAEVECRGKSIVQDDKECWSEQRVVKTYKWTKKDSVSLAIYSAELVLKNFEDRYPGDLRPRQAIEAAKKVLKRDTQKNRDAARSAAWSAESELIGKIESWFVKRIPKLKNI